MLGMARNYSRKYKEARMVQRVARRERCLFIDEVHC